MTKDDIKGIIRGVASSYGHDSDLMIRMAEIESGLNPSAVNKSSGATGLYQFLPKLWSSYGLNASTVFDPRANTDAAARKLKTAKTYLEDNGIRVEPWMLYLAHQQGNYGARIILDSAAQGLSINELPTEPANIRRNVLANAPDNVTTARGFLDWVRSKVGVSSPAAASNSTTSSPPASVPGSFPTWHWAAAGGVTLLTLFTIHKIARSAA